MTGPGRVIMLSPRDHDAVLFDLDGVLTRTASVHASAWKKLFDGFLEQRAARTGEPFVEFHIATDYPRYVDGKLRHDGVRAFLASRGVDLPAGDPTTAPMCKAFMGGDDRKTGLSGGNWSSTAWKPMRRRLRSCAHCGRRRSRPRWCHPAGIARQCSLRQASRSCSARGWTARRSRATWPNIQQGTTAEGVHLGAMAGSVDLIQRVWTGIEARGDVLHFAPELPRELKRLDLRIRYRGHSLDLRLTRDSLRVRGQGDAAAPICLCVNGRVHEFASGTTCVFGLNDQDCEGAAAERQSRMPA